jgi:hypothetical protein
MLKIEPPKFSGAAIYDSRIKFVATGETQPTGANHYNKEKIKAMNVEALIIDAHLASPILLDRR